MTYRNLEIMTVAGASDYKSLVGYRRWNLINALFARNVLRDLWRTVVCVDLMFFHTSV